MQSQLIAWNYQHELQFSTSKGKMCYLHCLTALTVDFWNVPNTPNHKEGAAAPAKIMQTDLPQITITKAASSYTFCSCWNSPTIRVHHLRNYKNNSSPSLHLIFSLMAYIWFFQKSEEKHNGIVLIIAFKGMHHINGKNVLSERFG